MRSIPLLLGLMLLAGCASPPTPVPATEFAPTDKPAPSTLEEARKGGYRIVNENGQTLYCREVPKLGSHVQKEVACLTEAEMLAAREASQRNFDNMKKVTPPPAGK